VARLSAEQLKLGPLEKDQLQRGFDDLSTAMLLMASFIGQRERSLSLEPYGVDAWKGFIRAHTLLQDIPSGQLIDWFDLHLVIEVNRRIHAPDTGVRARVARAVAMIVRGGRWDRGGELRQGRAFAPPDEYTDAELVNLKEAGVGVRRLTFAAGGTAIIEYPPPGQLRSKLDRLIGEVQATLATPTADPIGAAAKFQREFVALHPFGDSNGRTSRILMNRILAEYELPPAILADQNRDISLSPDAWRDEVARGISRSKEILSANRARGS
jgi:hypothetical protein